MSWPLPWITHYGLIQGPPYPHLSATPRLILTLTYLCVHCKASNNSSHVWYHIDLLLLTTLYNFLSIDERLNNFHRVTKG